MRHEQTSEHHRLDTICLIGLRTALLAMGTLGAGWVCKSQCELPNHAYQHRTQVEGILLM
jgi:hypothetical protein